MKLKHILENQILVPRRSKEEREKNLAAIHYRQIQEYIKNGSEGDLDLFETPLKTLPPNLIKVDGNLHLNHSQIKSLGNLEYIKHNLFLQSSSITSLGNLKKVGGNILLNSSEIKDLGNLEYVRYSLSLSDTPIISLGNLKYVGLSIYIENTPLSKKYTTEQIRQQVKIYGIIFNGI